MDALKQAAAEFLAQKRIAVAGVSRGRPDAANHIYRKLRAHGYTVFPLNPNASHVEGDRCYPALSAIEGGVDGVVIATHPDAAPAIVEQCAAAGVRRVWIHRGPGGGSWSAAAVERCRAEGIAVIDGACPMMFLEPDVAHRCMRWVLGALGKLPDGAGWTQAGGVPASPAR